MKKNASNANMRNLKLLKEQRIIYLMVFYLYFIGMDVARNLILIVSYYIYSKLLMILFSSYRCLLKAVFFWKTVLVVIYAKILRYSFIPIIYENFKSVFFLIYLGQTKIWKLACIFDLRNWKNWSSFKVLSLDNIIIYVHYVTATELEPTTT